jgi:glyceraldehyde 3-phosphate dehydrogenase
MIVDGHDLKVTAIKNPAELPHKELSVDIALECTGIFTSKEKAAAHLAAGAKRVLISAPADNVDLTVVYGVNHDKLNPEHKVVSNASCTTNCLAPVAKVLNDTIGTSMASDHGAPYTTISLRWISCTRTLPRRVAAVSMIPTSTGGESGRARLPELMGKLDGVAIRVPTPNVSVVGLKVVAKRATSIEEINTAMIALRVRAERRARYRGCAARLHRLQPQSRLVVFRARPDQGGQRHVRG